jgi:hypothetical protein
MKTEQNDEMAQMGEPHPGGERERHFEKDGTKSHDERERQRQSVLDFLFTESG